MNKEEAYENIVLAISGHNKDQKLISDSLNIVKDLIFQQTILDSDVEEAIQIMGEGMPSALFDKEWSIIKQSIANMYRYKSIADEYDILLDKVIEIMNKHTIGTYGFNNGANEIILKELHQLLNDGNRMITNE